MEKLNHNVIINTHNCPLCNKKLNIKNYEGFDKVLVTDISCRECLYIFCTDKKIKIFNFRIDNVIVNSFSGMTNIYIKYPDKNIKIPSDDCFTPVYYTLDSIRSLKDRILNLVSFS